MNKVMAARELLEKYKQPEPEQQHEEEHWDAPPEDEGLEDNAKDGVESDEVMIGSHHQEEEQAAAAESPAPTEEPPKEPQPELTEEIKEKLANAKAFMDGM